MTSNPDFLLSVYLRGGADGLTFLPPYNDAKYQERTFTRMYPPNHPGPEPKALSLGVPFGFQPTLGIHPALLPFRRLYNEGRLSFVHATGSVDSTRSHFNQQFFTEMGWIETSPVQDPRGLWTRYMQSCPNPAAPVSRGLSLTQVLPDYFRESGEATPVPNALEYGFPAETFTGLTGAEQSTFATQREALLTNLFDSTGAPTQDPYHAMLATIDTVDTAISPGYVPAAGAGSYGPTPFGSALKYAAQFAKASSGPDIVHVNIGGWDTHALQGVDPAIDGGGLHNLMGELAGNLEVFLNDTSGLPRNVTVIVITEFGRTVDENSSRGTDHGRGGVAIVASGRLQTVPYFRAGQLLQRGKIVTVWPGFDPAVENGDLDVTIDVRDLQAELLIKRMGLPGPGSPEFNAVFSSGDFAYNDRGLFKTG